MRFSSLARALLLLSAAVPALPARAAAPTFTDPRVAFSSGAPQSVLPIPSGGYHLYYIQNGFSVLSATSADGIAWAQEPGVRLSTAAGTLAASSITACGVFVTTTGVTRMLFVGVSSSGTYQVLSASSTDGLNFTPEPGIRLQFNGGLAFLDSPRPFPAAPGFTRLYYVRDAAGVNNPSNYQVFSASSADGGLTWADEGPRLPLNAYQVAVTTLTDSRMRLYLAAPAVSGSSATEVLTAVASDSLTFVQEGGLRLSTSAPFALSYPVVFRATETYRWRMLAAFAPGVAGSSEPFIETLRTANPDPLSMSPSGALNTAPPVTFTLAGEIFGPGASVTFTNGSSTLTASGVTVLADNSITGTLAPSGANLGSYSAVVTNSDGVSGTLPNAFFVDFANGSVALLDNLFHPLKGGSLKVTASVFNPGHLTAKLYTLRGELVKTLFDADIGVGTTAFSWAGDTSAGNTVASGLYILHLKGPKIDEKDKIIVIK